MTCLNLVGKVPTKLPALSSLLSLLFDLLLQPGVDLLFDPEGCVTAEFDRCGDARQNGAEIEFRGQPLSFAEPIRVIGPTPQALQAFPEILGKLRCKTRWGSNEF